MSAGGADENGTLNKIVGVIGMTWLEHGVCIGIGMFCIPWSKCFAFHYI